MTQYPFRDATLPTDERLDDLISRMTLDEKVGCLGTVPAVPRLGITASDHIEGYHGVAQGGPSDWGRCNPTPTTQFPQAYGLGSTWDPELVRAVAEQLALEARALFHNPSYSRGGLVVRAPNADLARDPRWGRTEEVYGEDAFHVARLATAFSLGLQGEGSGDWTCATLLKHFCANSNEDDRYRSSSNFDERQFREYYALPFERAVEEGGARSIMAAYNSVNGTPCHVHPMLREVVEGEWGLDGIICSDGQGLLRLVTKHQAFSSVALAAAACVRAGINQFLDDFRQPVTDALSAGLLEEEDLDRGLRGVFRVMLRLGLLDSERSSPHAEMGRTQQREPWRTERARALARDVTRKSIVLLENSEQLLPLDRAAVSSVAVVGPLCNQVLLDWYSGQPPYVITVRDGIERSAGPGVSVGWVGDMSDAALEMARDREVAVVCVGTHPEGNASWGTVSWAGEGKEAVDRKSLELAPDQVDFACRVCEANAQTIVVLIASFPVALPEILKRARAVIFVTHASQELGSAVADVLFGDESPGGKLAQTWPRSVAQLPPMLDYDLTRGRTYQYLREEPQYAFGYGLSYASFALSDLELDAEAVSPGGSVEVSVSIENVSRRRGDEVIQVYVRPHQTPIARPPLALKGFVRVTLAAGEKRRMTIPLRAKDLAYWNVERKAWALESGTLDVLVGTSSRLADLRLSRVLRLAGEG